MSDDGVLYRGDTEWGHYEVVDTNYGGRPARVMYSGNHQAAQSGMAHDAQPDLLFDYNQRFIELVRGLSPARVLLIGGGAFTLPITLLKEYPDLFLDIVELDPGLLPIARTYFGFEPSKRTRVFNGDGCRYLGTTADAYDLIIVDAFIHTDIPASLQGVEAAASFRRHLLPGGVLALNIIASQEGQRAASLWSQVAALQTAFKRVSVFPASNYNTAWQTQNYVLAAQMGSRKLDDFVRYAALDVPERLPFKSDS